MRNEHMSKSLLSFIFSDSESLQLISAINNPHLRSSIINQLFERWPKFCRNQEMEFFSCMDPFVDEIIRNRLNIGSIPDQELTHFDEVNNSMIYTYKTDLEGLSYLYTTSNDIEEKLIDRRVVKERDEEK